MRCDVMRRRARSRGESEVDRGLLTQKGWDAACWLTCSYSLNGPEVMVMYSYVVGMRSLFILIGIVEIRVARLYALIVVAMRRDVGDG